MPGADFAVANDYITKHSGARIKVAVAVDGSNVSMKALNVAMSFIQVERGDGLDLIHVDDGQQKKPDLTPTAIEHKCKLVTDKAGLAEASFFTIPRGDKGIIQSIIEKAESFGTELLIVGATGVKEEEAHGARQETIAVLGSVSDGSLRRTEMSVAVVKSTSYELEETKSFMLATDNSPSAQVAFALLLNKLIRPRDKVYVAYASRIVSHSTLLEDYKEELEERGIDHEILFLEVPGTGSIADSLLATAKEKSVDMLVLGTNGYSDMKLGSVSDACAKTSRCSTIVVKDPRVEDLGDNTEE